MPNFKPPPSCHVHVQSLDSAASPDSFAKREMELETGVLVSTDHGTMAGAITTYNLAKKNGLIPILGLEGYLRDSNDPILTEEGMEKDSDGEFLYNRFGSKQAKYTHFTCHFLDQQAYEMAAKLISKAPMEKHGSEEKPIFTWENIAELAALNATFCSGCLIGVVQRHLMMGRPDLAIKYYERYRSLAKPGNFYVEIAPHKCTHNWTKGIFMRTNRETRRFWDSKKLKTDAQDEVEASDVAREFSKGKHSKLLGIYNNRVLTEIEPEDILSVEDVEDFLPNECMVLPDGTTTTDVQERANKFVIELALKYGDPIILGDDAHYAYPDQRIVQDVRLAQSGSWRFYGNYARQTGDELFDYFRSSLGWSKYEMDRLIGVTFDWSTRFKYFKLEYQPSLAGKFYPANTLEYVFKLIQQKGRMPWGNPKYEERLKEEIKRFHKNGKIDLLTYFLPIHEVVEEYNRLGIITGVGRGSAASALIPYLLGITHVDPIEYDLPLDRFYNEDRAANGRVPDIDQDLPFREPLIGKMEEYVEFELDDGEYGPEGECIKKGTVLKAKKSEKINTTHGVMTIHEAIKYGVDIVIDDRFVEVNV